MMAESESDETLLGQALAGGEEAFTILYRRRQASVYRFAYQMSGSAALAEEATQETFLALLDRGAGFRAGRGSLLPFLFGIARNQVLRLLRSEGAAPVAESAAVDLAGADDTHGEFERRQLAGAVRRALLGLPESYREVLVLCDLQELSYNDAAGVLGCPVGTVRSRLARGREMLAERLRPTRCPA
ncbi:MAG: RNA polymerase sigma factor [Acidobacteria bacterium]|nr:RNA polymerase sigma factor [Acidobacteriota bacterium]